MKFLVMILIVLMMVAGCDSAAGKGEEAESIPIITIIERGALGSGLVSGVDNGALEVGRIYTVMIEGEGLLVVCAIQRLPGQRVQMIEIELAGIACNSDR